VEGINPGDVVANSSFEKLQPNSKVVIAKGNQPGAQGGTPPAATQPPATKPTKSGNKATP
jgi:hypothetical protein